MPADFHYSRRVDNSWGSALIMEESDLDIVTRGEGIKIFVFSPRYLASNDIIVCRVRLLIF